MYKGLHFFYENLSPGGYIMLHDYNNRGYKGVKAALRKFSEEKKVPYFPICDACGSAIIMKA
jgi:O-methyltransferase